MADDFQKLIRDGDVKGLQAKLNGGASIETEDSVR
jgi:hypothetical protein